MAGRKQHHIPQSLLRGFGKKGSGKSILVTVYNRDGRIFITSTTGVAAKRDFYSEPSAGTTLDDKITDFEQTLGPILDGLREHPLGAPVEPNIAAEFVSHLTIRPAHLRDSFASATSDLLDKAEERFTNVDWLREQLGLDEDKPSGIVLDEFEKLYETYRPQLLAIGITKEDFVERLFPIAKLLFVQNAPQGIAELQSVLGALQPKLGSMVEAGHRNALHQTLTPEPRVSALEDLSWTVQESPKTALVLPDCVALGQTDEGWAPLVHSSNNLSAVILPIESRRALVGAPSNLSLPPAINAISAQCSWDFFVARDELPEYERLVLTIGEITRAAFDGMVSDTFDEIE